jgi:hypothetical protein
VHRDPPPGGLSGQDAGLAELGALERWSPTFTGAWWGQIEQGGVGRQSGRPGRTGEQQRLAVIGGVPDPVHQPVRKLHGDQPDQVAGQIDRAGGALARPQPK